MENGFGETIPQQRKSKMKKADAASELTAPRTIGANSGMDLVRPEKLICGDRINRDRDAEKGDLDHR